jgi:hypothetical protein
MFYRLWTYKKILFLLYTLSMTISFSCYNYNNYKKWDTIYLVQFLIKVDIILSKGWSLLQVFISLTYNSSNSILWIQCGIIILIIYWFSFYFNLLIYSFYLVGHWGKWSIRRYYKLFAITCQFDMFSLCCIFHYMVNSTFYSYQFFQSGQFDLNNLLIFYHCI